MKAKALVLFAVFPFVLASCQGKPTETSGSGSLQATAVKVGTLQKKIVSEVLDLNGTMVAEHDVTIKSETQGKIVQMLADVGDHVEKGAVLAQVDDVIKKADWQVAEAQLGKAKKDLARTLDLKSQGVSTDNDVDNARLALASAQSQATIAAKDLDNTKIRAPFRGVVSERLAEAGAMMSPGVSVFRVISLDDLKVVVNINEKDIFQVHLGNPVQVTSTVDPEKTVVGHVKSISPQAQSAQNFPVEIEIHNSATSPFLDGMSVTVHFQFGQQTIKALPRSALVGSVSTPQVYVVVNGKASLRTIKVGSTYNTDLEVLGGLGPDDQVVVNGQNNLQDGVPVDVVP